MAVILPKTTRCQQSAISQSNRKLNGLWITEKIYNTYYDVKIYKYYRQAQLKLNLIKFSQL